MAEHKKIIIRAPEWEGILKTGQKQKPNLRPEQSKGLLNSRKWPWEFPNSQCLSKNNDLRKQVQEKKINFL